METLIKLCVEYLNLIKGKLDFYTNHMNLCLKVEDLLKLKNIPKDKYANYEYVMSKIKQVKFIFNTYNVDSYEKFSQLDTDDIKLIKKKLDIINKAYDEVVDFISKEFEEDINNIKLESLKILKTNNLEKLKDYKSSYNVFSSVVAYLKPFMSRQQNDMFELLLEEIKDDILEAKEIKPSIITTLYNMNSYEVDLGEFLGVKPFKLTKTYFKEASKILNLNIIVLNLSKKVKFKYNLPTESVQFLTEENTKIRYFELLKDDIIFDADEVTYFDVGSKNTLIIKTLGSVHYVLSNFWKLPDSPKYASHFIHKVDRIHTYNQIFEDAFFDQSIVEHPKRKDHTKEYQKIQLNTFKYKILNTIKESKKDPKSIILEAVSTQIKDLFNVEVYEYIKEFETLDFKLETELKKGTSVEETFDKLFKPERNIYKSVVDSMESIM